MSSAAEPAGKEIFLVFRDDDEDSNRIIEYDIPDNDALAVRFMMDEDEDILIHGSGYRECLHFMKGRQNGYAPLGVGAGLGSNVECGT